MNGNDLARALAPARRRLWVQRLIRLSARGAMWGALVGMVIALAGMLVGGPRLLVSLSCLTPLLGLAVGVMACLSRYPSLRETARFIDRTASLKDRIQSALQFAGDRPRSEYHRLLIADAVNCLSTSRCKQVSPWRWPREASWAVAACAAYVLPIMLLMPASQARLDESSVGRTSSRAVREEAREVAGEILELQRSLDALVSAKSESTRFFKPPLNMKMDEVVGQLDAGLSRLLARAHSSDNAMLHLARMNAALDSTINDMNAGRAERALQAFGQFTESNGWGAVAAAMKRSDYELAAQSLNELTDQTKVSVIEALKNPTNIARLHELARQVASLGEQTLSVAIEQFASSLAGDSKQTAANLQKLSDAILETSRHIEANRLLAAELAKLDEHKHNLSAEGLYCRACRFGEGACEGGFCKTNLMNGCGSPVRAAGAIAKGESGEMSPHTHISTNHGSASAGRATTESRASATSNLDVPRKREQLTGQLGQGESRRVEVIDSASGVAHAPYRDTATSYHKSSDAAIEGEQVPLARRALVKRYFELLHAEDETASAKDEATQSAKEVGKR